MTTIVAERTITALDLAGRLRRSEEFVEELLAESERGGVVERVEGGWRLSTSAERQFGQSLREIRAA